jgi:hypothetical protein
MKQKHYGLSQAGTKQEGIRSFRACEGAGEKVNGEFLGNE